jgi:hypothetical protein
LASKKQSCSAVRLPAGGMASRGGGSGGGATARWVDRRRRRCGSDLHLLLLAARLSKFLNYVGKRQNEGARCANRQSQTCGHWQHLLLSKSLKNVHIIGAENFWNFLYIFFHDFAKIYSTPEILQNYTSAAVTHGVRDITPWSTAVGAASSRPVVLPS